MESAIVLALCMSSLVLLYVVVCRPVPPEIPELLDARLRVAVRPPAPVGDEVLAMADAIRRSRGEPTWDELHAVVAALPLCDQPCDAPATRRHSAATIRDMPGIQGTIRDFGSIYCDMHAHAVTSDLPYAEPLRSMGGTTARELVDGLRTSLGVLPHYEDIVAARCDRGPTTQRSGNDTQPALVGATARSTYCSGCPVCWCCTCAVPQGCSTRTAHGPCACPTWDPSEGPGVLSLRLDAAGIEHPSQRALAAELAGAEPSDAELVSRRGGEVLL